jgi:hypothetical protein
METKDLTILVQGKLHKHTLMRIQKYKKWADTILLCCDVQDDISILDQYDVSGCTVYRPDLTVADTTMNNFRGWFQCKSIYEGLKLVTTPYTLKVRSDYWVGNLEPFVQKMSEYPEKYVTNNMYFRPDWFAHYHISDHMVGGKTEDMLKGYEVACWRLENHSRELRQCYNDHRFFNNSLWEFPLPFDGQTVSNASAEMPSGEGITPEVLIGTSLVYAKNLIANAENVKEKMIQCFEIVPVEDMKPYLNKYFTNEILHWGPYINNVRDL